MKYGLIGEHLPHSFSKEIHAKIADYDYELLELTPDAVGEFMERADFCAINVTIPYKQTVMPYLSEIDDAARAIGAVNTVVNRGGRLYGYNTDFYGMSAMIGRLGISLSQKKVLILGTGGTAHTARAVATALGARAVITVGRRAGVGVITYEQAYADHTDADVIINTTPCGMFPYADGSAERAATPIALDRFEDLCGVIDAVYNPLRTNLVLEAKKRGIAAEGGLYMLVAQAVLASAIFTDTAFDESLVPRVFAEVLADKENIVLVGMPASGKTTVGKALSRVLGRAFVDTDAEIVRREGRAISEIFSADGEAYFRKVEAEVVRDVANTHTGAVIATGGGVILRDDNVNALRRTGRIYFLDRALEALLPTPDRPTASSAEAIRARYHERYGRYLKGCDRQIVVDEVIDHTVSAIRKDFFQ